MPPWNLILGLGLSLLSVACLHLLVHAVVGVIGRRAPRLPARSLRFLVLIPAHDEEAGLGDTLTSVLRAAAGLTVEIQVVADNCSDGTAEVARRHGITVLERHDSERRGKGWALEWALARNDLTAYDAVSIIDADTLVEENFFTASAASLLAGADAVQCNYVMRAFRDSPVAVLGEIANAAENHLFYKPRGLLGLAVLLRGSGMSISTATLAAHPMDSHSLVEDIDYAIGILRAGAVIDYTMDSSVHSSATASFGQTWTQKSRWASGTLGLVLRQAPRLVAAGLAGGRLRLTELGLSLLILSRPTLVYAALLLGCLTPLAEPGRRLALLGWAAALVVFLAAFIGAGVCFVERRGRALKALAVAPVYVAWYLVLQAAALLPGRRRRWNRTGRD